MSYVGYIPLIKEFVRRLPENLSISLIEVGVDRGTTLIPLVAFLSRNRSNFFALGVDVAIQESVQLMFRNLDLKSPEQQVGLTQENSLHVLPRLAQAGAKFDVVLLDGDHNYHTVSKELESLEELTYQHSLVVIDDYDGRWSERDLWYAEREGYQDVKIATPRVETQKHGVKPAVDEWLAAHPGWEKHQPIQGEPVVLLRKQ